MLFCDYQNMSRTFSHFFMLNSHSLKPPSVSMPSKNKPMVMAIQIQKHDYWASIEAQIDDHLKKAIPVRDPISVFEPMHNLVNAAPKTKAPLLCVAAYELVGSDVSSNDIIVAASALHLVHTAPCVHEQLPLKDWPSLKPNIKPIANHTFNPNIELLIGDGILPFAFELLARSDPAQNNSSRTLRMIVELSRCAKSLVHGQWEEIELWKSNGCDDARVVHVCKKKEGELHACGAACGAILGGGSEEEIERMRRFGLNVGIIEGIVNGMGIRIANKTGLLDIVKELRVLAMKELEHFKGRHLEPIASLVHENVDDFYKERWYQILLS